MKVCPLCEFIYEDEQGLCDMDGATLVYDPAPRALAQVTMSDGLAPLARSRWKHFAATALVGIVLGTVLVLVFQALSLRMPEQLSTTEPQRSNYPIESVNGTSGLPPILDLASPVPLAPLMEATPESPDPSVDALPGSSPQTPSPQSTHLPERRLDRTSNVTTVVKPSPGPARRSVARLAPGRRESELAQARPIESNHKESKLGSFLKKTGRILKRPFDF